MKAFKLALMAVFLLLMLTGCTAHKETDADEDRSNRESKRESDEASGERTDSENGLGFLFGFNEKASEESDGAAESESTDDGVETEHFDNENDTDQLNDEDETELYDIVNDTDQLNDEGKTELYDIVNDTDQLNNEKNTELYDNVNDANQLKDEAGSELYEDGEEMDEDKGPIGNQQDVQDDTEVPAEDDSMDSNNSQELEDSSNTPSLEQDQSNSPIIGTWRSGDSSRPTYIGMLDSNVEYVFGQDGIYTHIVITSINYIYQCTAYTGSYTVAKGEVMVTDRFKSTFGIKNYDWREAYEAAEVAELAPFEDAVWPLEVIDSENITVNGIALYRVN